MNLNRVFHYKPFILETMGYPYFWKHPHVPILKGGFKACRHHQRSFKALKSQRLWESNWAMKIQWSWTEKNLILGGMYLFHQQFQGRLWNFDGRLDLEGRYQTLMFLVMYSFQTWPIFGIYVKFQASKLRVVSMSGSFSYIYHSIQPSM